MKKIVCALMLASLLIFSACDTNETENDSQVEEPTAAVVEPEENLIEAGTLSVVAPAGAPAVIIADYYKNNPDLVTVGNIDTVKVALVTESADIVLAPSNLGAMLISNGSANYSLESIITAGNLYLVGTEDALETETSISLFGEAAVPEKIYDVVSDAKGYEYEEIFFTSVQDVLPLIVTGKTNLALLAEPIATVAISKAKASDITLVKLVDLQEEYATVTGSQNGFPQACVFVSKTALENKPLEVEAFLESLEEYNSIIHEDSSILIDDINVVGVENIGLPSAEIAANTLNGMNVTYISADDYEMELTYFLNLFGIDYNTVK